MDTFIWISVWTITNEKKITHYRQRLIDYKMYLHQSRTQEVEKNRKLREESPLTSKGVLSQWTKWEPPDCPHEVGTAQRRCKNGSLALETFRDWVTISRHRKDSSQGLHYSTWTLYQSTYLKLVCAAPFSQTCSVELDLFMVIYYYLYCNTVWYPQAGPHCEKHWAELIKWD